LLIYSVKFSTFDFQLSENSKFITALKDN